MPLFTKEELSKAIEALKNHQVKSGKDGINGRALFLSQEININGRNSFVTDHQFEQWINREARKAESAPSSSSQPTLSASVPLAPATKIVSLSKPSITRKALRSCNRKRPVTWVDYLSEAMKGESLEEEEAESVDEKCAKSDEEEESKFLKLRRDVSAFHRRFREGAETESDRLLKAQLMAKAEAENQRSPEDRFVPDREERKALIKSLEKKLVTIIEALEIQGVETLCTSYDLFNWASTFDSFLGTRARRGMDKFPGHASFFKDFCLVKSCDVARNPGAYRGPDFLPLKRAFVNEKMCQKYEETFGLEVKSSIPWDLVELSPWPIFSIFF